MVLWSQTTHAILTMKRINSLLPVLIYFILLADVSQAFCFTDPSAIPDPGGRKYPTYSDYLVYRETTLVLIKLLHKLAVI